MQTTKYFFLTVLLSGLLIIGCDKSTEADDDSVLYEDMAESISSSMGDESGGTSDQMADMVSISGSAGITTSADLGKAAGFATIDTTYDTATGWWTLVLSRQKESSLRGMSASISRTYRFRFLKDVNSPSSFQKYWRVPKIGGFDTATAVNFKIVSGTGTFKGPRVSHNLTRLSGSWIITNANTDTITINSDSTYVRSSTDSIKTRNLLRTFVQTTTMNFVNVKSPRFSPRNATLTRANLHQAFSGTINGNYSAQITFQNGDLYRERSVNRDFTITIGGGEGTISIAGKGSFRCDLSSGNRK